jgi:WD40 repeat protein
MLALQFMIAVALCSARYVDSISSSTSSYIYHSLHFTLSATAAAPAQHDMVISGISWSAANDKIVTCSHDRNAYVWKYNVESQKWVPTLCVLRIDRAAIAVEWSPDGSKFAVASSSKSVPVCFHDSSQFNDWYVSKSIKKHKSTVSSVTAAFETATVASYTVSALTCHQLERICSGAAVFVCL